MRDLLISQSVYNCWEPEVFVLFCCCLLFVFIFFSCAFVIFKDSECLQSVTASICPDRDVPSDSSAYSMSSNI